MTVLYAFKGGSDGGFPLARVIQDSAGNLYGTTAGPGTGNDGTVFKLAPDGTETVLHRFRGSKHGDGAHPWAGLIADRQGNLYGAMDSGGMHGWGSVFRLAPDGTETLLYSFAADGDGAGPDGTLIRDKAGNLYGTTVTTYGGRGCEFGVDCGGTVFRLAPDGTYTVLHSFVGEQRGDGADPEAGLIRDEKGNLYGTTTKGGSAGCTPKNEPDHGCGTVFELSAHGGYAVFYAFKGSDDGDGSWPAGGLIEDRAGNFYGTTNAGGGADCYLNLGCGTVFKLAPDGSETVLHIFTRGRDGAYPDGALIRDKAGNLYGTTNGGGAYQYGTVFKLAPDGTLKVLYAFRGRKDGGAPRAGLMKGDDDRLYGTTSEGGALAHCYGSGCGTVFRLDK